MIENPRIISICSICKSKTSTCKLIQYRKSGNYRLICDLCYTNPYPTDIIIDLSNYNENQSGQEQNINNNQTSECEKIKTCFYNFYCKTKTFLHYIRKKCVKGIKTIGKKIQIKERLHCCRVSNIDNDTDKLEENV